MTASSRNPRRYGTLVAAVAVLSLVLAPAGAADASPKPVTGTSAHQQATKKATSKKTTSKKTTKTSSRTPAAAKVTTAATLAATNLPSDLSRLLPQVRHDGTTGDFMNLGHQQRAVVENGFLNIYDSPERGGALLRSTPTDLSVPGPASSLWSPINTKMADLASAQNLAAVYLAWTPDALYMAGHNKNAVSAADLVTLYRLPSDGHCASANCATWVKHFDAAGGSIVGIGPYATLAVTALATGKIGTRNVLAAGLNLSGPYQSYPSQRTDQLGVWVLDADTGAQLGSTYNGFVDDHNQTPVTALAWDPTGSGLLAFGVASATRIGYAIKVSAAGVISNPTFWDFKVGNINYSPAVLSAAVGLLADKKTPIVAFGLSDGSVRLWDPATSSSTLKASATDNKDPVDALTFVDRVTGTAGAQDLVAVSSKGNSARVLRYDGGTTLKPQAVAPSGVTTTDVGGIQSWFPGYKSGGIRFENTSDQAIVVSFASRPTEAYGCWFAPSVPGDVVMPSTGSITLAAHQLSDFYTVGGLTAGISGNCAQGSDFVGQWASYLTMAPVGRPAQRSTVKLVADRDGGYHTTVVGGSLGAAVVEQNAYGPPLGTAKIDLSSPVEPVGTDPLSVSGVQLDPAGTDRPVYRIDVAASTWTLPVSNPKRIATVLEPIQVTGTTDAGGLIPLGYLVPQGLPSRATSSGTITLAPVSFYWQNPAPGAGTQLRGFLIGNGHAAAVVQLSRLTPITGGAEVSGVTVCPISGSDGCDGTATPYANGLDQSPLTVKIYSPTGSAPLPLTDPAYQKLYYRDADGDLITGLIPEDGSSYTRVSPYRGAYPNDGSDAAPRKAGTPVGGRYGYLSTTKTGVQQIHGFVGGYAGGNGGDIAVDGKVLLTQVTAAPSTKLSVTNGFYLTGCSGDYTNTNVCRLANPVGTSTTSNPATYLTTDPVTRELRIGLQFSYTAQTATNSLPLEQKANQGEHTVAAAPLSVNNGEVTFADAATDFQPADNIDTFVVTHGQQIPVSNINVGEAN